MDIYVVGIYIHNTHMYSMYLHIYCIVDIHHNVSITHIFSFCRIFKGDKIQGATICDCVWEAVAAVKKVPKDNVKYHYNGHIEVCVCMYVHTYVHMYSAGHHKPLWLSETFDSKYLYDILLHGFQILNSVNMLIEYAAHQFWDKLDEGWSSNSWNSKSSLDFHF